MSSKLSMNTEIVEIKKPKDDLSVNVIIGQSHFIKTVEDIYEAIMSSVPQPKFAIAFCEASSDKLIRYTATDQEMEKLALENAQALQAGHTFVIFLKDIFPINVLPAIKAVPEVCHIFCATANPLQVLVVESEQGRGVIGVIDGSNSGQVETKEDKSERREFLRKIGYKKFK